MNSYTMLINGESVATEKTFDIINPASGEVFAQCPDADATMVDKAVAAARGAFAEWSQTSMDERKHIVQQIAQAIEANMPELMQLVTMETGKPMGGLNGIGSGMEVGGAVAWTQVSTMFDLPIEVIQDNEEARIEVHRKPIGVVGSITPWNWPMLIATWHVMPALVAGNTVVIKPSPNTPLSTIRLVELANDILPAGVLNIVTGGNEVGQAISDHPDINKIIFTGSTATGRKIMQSASANLKRLTLELGGNDAGIVLDDIDVKTMADKIFTACFHNNGQTCAALKRLYVHESIHDELAVELAQRAKSVVVGNGLEESSELGPIQNMMQYKKVMNLAEDAKNNGGKFIAGGNPIEGKGFFFEPTVVTGLSDGSRLVDEEPFGPILPIIKYSDIEEVIARANNSDAGLGGSVWSSDVKRATELAMRLECGSVWVNDHGAIQPDAPFGGIKQSGMGVEFGRYGLEECTSIQTVKIAK